MSKANFLEEAVIKHVLGGGDYTRPANVHVALFTGDPGETGSLLDEVDGAGYARVEISNVEASWEDDGQVTGSHQLSNAAAVTFPESEGAWGTVTHFAIMDAATVGNMLYYAALDNAREVSAAGVTLKFEIGDLKVRED